MSKPIVIGITGLFGSGKTTAASFFENHGYRKIVLSSFLEEEAKLRGKKKITRKLLQDIGNEWREKYGRDVLVKKALESIHDASGKFVIDGVRNVGEIEALKKSTDFKLLAIIADRPIRFTRLKKIKRREDLTPELFFKLDKRDFGLGQKNTGLQVAFCVSLADHFILNNSTLEQFNEKLNHILNT